VVSNGVGKLGLDVEACRTAFQIYVFALVVVAVSAPEPECVFTILQAKRSVKTFSTNAREKRVTYAAGILT
jgi:hypothetical protein